MRTCQHILPNALCPACNDARLALVKTNTLDELKRAVANARAAGYEVECTVKSVETL